jgi:adenosylcobinamide-phosphate synthase
MPLWPTLPLATAALAGVLVDRALGEPRRFHPLVGFGRLADTMEQALRRGAPGRPLDNRLRGLGAWLVLVLPWTLIAAVCGAIPYFGWLTDALLLWFALGHRALAEHARAVAEALRAGDLEAARAAVGQVVSRETADLDSAGVAGAAVESVLENGNDAVFGTLFWFFVAGGAGALLFRLANTLDAMWGYRDTRRLYFGWTAARLDDLLNFIPARLTALTYALLGRTDSAFACWKTQASAWSSPNAGPVMAAGAGALQVRLGGAATYHGQIETRPPLGEGDAPQVAHIDAAVALVERGLWLWLGLYGLLALGAALA